MNVHRRLSFTARAWAAVLVSVSLAGACSNNDSTGPTTNNAATSSCSSAGTVQLAVAQAARIDCSGGGTTFSVAGNGASYLVVPQFAVSLVPNTPVSYRLSSSASTTADVAAVAANMSPLGGSLVAGPLPGQAQRAFDDRLRSIARQRTAAGTWSGRANRTIATAPVPSVGSTRTFRVLSSETTNAFASVTARLAFAGASVLIYIDTLAPTNGFTTDQLQAFGTLFDQTLYPIDTAAFGSPSDVDANGHVIMLMTPAVNGLTRASDCGTSGFVAGFFNEEDLGGSANDPNSNHGEIFYSIVPDPLGTVSCTHSVANVGLAVPSTFMHELQHLISFSQHVVVHNSQPEYGWLDEGLSIVAEELGSLFYENKCPGTACRTNPAQIFPDSSQGFVQNFLFDSYVYALRPDTASVTLHSDSDGGFSWRGGDWLLMRWLGDQMPAGFYRKLDENTTTGVANIESVSGQSFPSLFGNFGLSLVTDSLAGLPRTTAPAADRFVTRNVRQLWARLFATSGGPDVPRAFPIVLTQVTSDSTARSMVPGTSTYFRLDTPAGASTVVVTFASPNGQALSANLKPQVALFRLPPGQ